MGEQLPLFADAFQPPPADPLKARVAQEHAEAAAIAARLPDSVRFGTSSWSFPGWAGIVWEREASAAWLAREGLRTYARHPLLRTVGIDRGFYGPIPEQDLVRYAEQLPAGFPCCAKAPEAVTSPQRVGGKQPNPDFMQARRLEQEMVVPFLRSFRDHVGPFILQFPPFPRDLRMDGRAFAAALHRLLGGLSGEARYAVELRDPSLLGPAYAETLAAHGAAHVYNYATDMPYPAEQAHILPPDHAPFLVIRLLLRPGSRYAERKEAFAPFDRVADPDPRMRAEVVDLLRRGAIGKPSFVLVNNKAEGSAPLTARALAELLAA